MVYFRHDGLVLSSTKVYCTCGKSADGYSQLCVLSKHDKPVSVCGHCRRPSQLTWKAFKDHCPECFAVFSSPVEKVCKECFTGEQYSSWKYAANQYVEIKGVVCFTRLKTIA